MERWGFASHAWHVIVWRLPSEGLVPPPPAGESYYLLAASKGPHNNTDPKKNELMLFLQYGISDTWLAVQTFCPLAKIPIEWGIDLGEPTLPGILA
jgi:hypothetical protein